MLGAVATVSCTLSQSFCSSANATPAKALTTPHLHIGLGQALPPTPCPSFTHHRDLGTAHCTTVLGQPVGVTFKYPGLQGRADLFV